MKQQRPIPDETLSAYLDHQLNERSMRRVEKALAEDEALRERLAALRATVELLHEAPMVTVPRSFVLSEAMVQAADGSPQRPALRIPSFWQRWLPRMMPIATAAIALLFLISLFSPRLIINSPKATLAPTARDVVQKEVLSTQVVEKVVEKPASLEAPAAAKEESPQTEALAIQATTGPVGGKKSAPEVTKEVSKEVAVAAAAPAATSSPEMNAVTLDAGQPQSLSTPTQAKTATPDATVAEKTAREETNTPETPKRRLSISPLSLGLGLLLFIFIFLTWRVSERSQIR